MSSVSGIRLPGLATGMDTEAMIKEMLTGEQNKVDKAKQKEQTIKWQQEIYRDVIKDIQGLNDKYFSITSKNSVTNASAWNTMAVSSSNSSVITATGSAGANNVNYKFDVISTAQPAKITSDKKIDGVSSDTKLGSISGFNAGDFYIELDGKTTKIEMTAEDTFKSLSDKIENATGGKITASYSEMTGKFTIETKETGSNAKLKIVDEAGNGSKNLDFLGIKTGSITNPDGTIVADTFNGSPTDIKVTDANGNEINTIKNNSNSFTIDGITYDVHATGKSDITSKQDEQPVIDNMKAFVEDYNKLMDKMYDLVTEKKNKEYSPLTEAQKKDMSEEEIERWEKKSKEGLLRNDSEMRKFMDDMQGAIFGDKIQILSEMGITSHQDYNKKGQIALDEEKFRKALETNSDKVHEVFAKDSSSVMENMKSTVKKYTGGSSSIFAQKAGIEKTASVAKNFYSEQLKRQAETIKLLQRKMDNKEDSLYKKFAALESSMNKLNSQMNHFAQM